MIAYQDDQRVRICRDQSFDKDGDGFGAIVVLVGGFFQPFVLQFAYHLYNLGSFAEVEVVRAVPVHTDDVVENGKFFVFFDPFAYKG